MSFPPDLTFMGGYSLITKLYRLEIVERLTTDFENTSVSNVINKEYPVPFW